MTERQTHQRADLSDLVRARREELGLSLDQLERRAVDPETRRRLGSTWLNRLELNQVSRAPELWRLHALAAGLDVSFGRIQDAAAGQWFNIDPVEGASGEARALVRDLDRLTPEAREQVRRLVDLLKPPNN